MFVCVYIDRILLPPSLKKLYFWVTGPYDNIFNRLKSIGLNRKLLVPEKSPSYNRPNPSHATRPCLNTSAAAWAQVTALAAYYVCRE